MTYKDEIKTEIETMLKNNNESKVIPYFKILFKKALEESKSTGQSVESITYELLEGLEEAYTLQQEKIEDILQKASQVIIDIIHDSAKNNITKKHQKVNSALDELINTVEFEKYNLKESLDAFKHYALDHNHKNFKENLINLELSVIKRINKLSNMIKYKLQIKKDNNVQEESLI